VVSEANGKVILSLDASSTAVGWCAAQEERYLNSAEDDGFVHVIMPQAGRSQG